MRVVDAAVAGGQRQVHAHIILRRKLRRHQLLGAAQHERPDAPAQASGRGGRVRGVLTGFGRAGVQVAEGAGGGEEPVRHNRQQRPQLHEVVLQGRAGHRNLGARGHGAGDRPGAGAGIFDELRLVQQERAPAGGARALLRTEPGRVGDVRVLVHAQQRVAGQHQVRPGHAFGQRGLAGGGFGNGDDLCPGQETFGLRRPVRDNGGRRDHEEGCERLAGNRGAVLLDGVGEQGEGLHGLAQAHVVGEDAAHAMLVQEGEPAVTLHLVGAQGGAQARGDRVLSV